MNNKLLTVVVPVYKVEKYINQCLDSLILRDDLMPLLEVIIVNDGTPDHSADMAREYVKRHPQTFRVIDKENGGHGSAWNVGLRKATGKYVRFLDSDDWLSNLELFITILRGLDEDMIYTNVSRFYEDIEKEEVDVLNSALDYNKSYELKNVNLHKISFGFWNWTYKTKLLKAYDPLFVEHVYYDDAILFYAPIIVSKSFRALDMLLYNYRLGRPGQTMNPIVQCKHAADYSPVSLSIISFVKCRIFDIPASQQNYIKESLSKYIDSCFNWFLLLDYHEFNNVMKEWLPQIKANEELLSKRGNRVRLYQMCPTYLSYAILKKYASIRD